MLQKEWKIVAVFKGMHDALKAEELCKKAKIDGRLIPIPADISADCGMSYMMKPQEKERFMAAIANVIEIEGLYERYLR